MAIAYDAFSRATEGTDDLSWTHTPAGTPAGVLVFVVAPEGTDHIVGVTYGGTTLNEIVGSPVLKSGGEAGCVHAFYLGSGVPSGAQTVAVDTDSSLAAKRMGLCFTVTASTTVTVQSVDTSINSNAVANPSASLALGGRSCFVAEAFFSGQDATTSYAAPAGWTQHREFDFGTSGGGEASYDTVDTADVTIGFTQASEDAICLAVALREADAYDITATTASFVFTGIDAILSKTITGYTLTADLTEFTVTDVVATLTHDYPIVATLGEFDAVSINVILQYQRLPFDTEIGTFTVTDNDIILTHGYPLVAELATFDCVDYDAELTTTRSLSATVSEWYLAANEVDLVHDYPIIATVGAFDAVSINATLTRGYTLAAVSSTHDMVVVGCDAVLTKSGTSDYTMVAGAGDPSDYDTLLEYMTAAYAQLFRFTGKSATFQIQRSLQPLAVTQLLTFEPMDGAIVNAVSSEATNEPAAHSIALDPNFAWQANEVGADAHILTIDLGEERGADGFTFLYRSAITATPVLLDTVFACEVSIDNVNWLSLTLRDALGNTPADAGQVHTLIRTRMFWANDQITRYYGRYWRFTITGTAAPLFRPLYNARYSMCWLHTYHELYRGAAFPVDDAMVFPVERLPLAFGKQHQIGRNVNRMTTFSRTWLLTANDYEALAEVIRNCNGTQRPLLLKDTDTINRLCYIDDEPIQITTIDTDLYQVTCRFIEIPIVKREAYH